MAALLLDANMLGGHEASHKKLKFMTLFTYAVRMGDDVKFNLENNFFTLQL